MNGGAELGQGTSEDTKPDGLVELAGGVFCSLLSASAAVAAAMMEGSSGKMSSMPLFTTVLVKSN